MLIRRTAMMAHANQCNAHHNVLPVSTMMSFVYRCFPRLG